MTVVFSAILLALSGVQTKNSADCMGLPSDQQLACIREIRAGRSFDVHYPADLFPAAAAPQAEPQAQAPQAQPQPPQQVQQQAQVPVQPALVSDLYQRQIVFAAEKQAASTERIAEATERMALLSTIWTSVALLGFAITVITFLPSK